MRSTLTGLEDQDGWQGSDPIFGSRDGVCVHVELADLGRVGMAGCDLLDGRPERRQGGHHSAQKSTRTGRSLSRTSGVKLASFSVKVAWSFM